jgi:hypothetical protein
MNDDYMIQQQYSKSVAMAQVAGELDTLDAQFESAVLAYTLPPPLANIRLRIARDGAGDGLVVRAHGMILKSRFDHVWLGDGHDHPPLGGAHPIVSAGQGSEGWRNALRDFI